MEYFKDCTKCAGTGMWSSAKKRGSGEGRCFACAGTGNNFINAGAKAAYYTAKAVAAESFVAENPWLMGVALFFGATGNPIAGTMLAWAKKGSMPTEKMFVAVFRAMTRLIEKREAPPEITSPVVSGKGTIVEGKIISVKERVGMYGISIKMLVKDERGFKVWGTVPRAILDDAERGMRVRFVANTKMSDDDECFGFFSRPRKAELLSA